MTYHTTTDGLIGLCCTDVWSCPLAVSSQHFPSRASALSNLVTREYVLATSIYADFDDDWKYAPIGWS